MKKIISTTEAPAAVGPYSQAVRVGSTIYCAGQIPLDPKSGQIVPGDIGAQTRRVLENIAAVLRESGVREHREDHDLPDQPERFSNGERNLRLIFQKRTACPFYGSGPGVAEGSKRRNRSHRRG